MGTGEGIIQNLTSMQMTYKAVDKTCVYRKNQCNYLDDVQRIHGELHQNILYKRRVVQYESRRLIFTFEGENSGNGKIAFTGIVIR